MRVEAAELIRVRLGLRQPFVASHATERAREILLVHLLTDTADGWGECDALSAPTYTPEHLDGAQLVLERHLLGMLAAAGDVRPSGVRAALEGVRGHHMAKAALEMAMLDAQGHLDGTSLAQQIGATATSVAVGAVLGMAPSPAALREAVESLLAEGYRRVKVKIAPGAALGPLGSLRAHFGNQLCLQADANGSYRLDACAELRGLEDLGVELLEQPLAPRSFAEHAELRRRIRTPVSLDESVDSVEDVRLALRLGSCDALNLKPARLGGWLAGREAHDVAREGGCRLLCGGMLESGIGRAAAVAFAALGGFDLSADLSPSDRYLEQDLTAPMELHDGALAVPTGPGVGVQLHLDVVDRHSTSRRRWKPERSGEGGVR